MGVVTTGLLVAYGVVTVLLGSAGLYYALLAVERIVRSRRAEPAPDLGEQRPSVTVQIPVYNERHVVDRVLRAVGRFDWPADRLQVQVIDDSTDSTTEVVERELAALAEAGIAVEHIRRDDRTGYKAGAVQTGLETATGEFVALFDADFVPPAEFLQETVPQFRDPEVGCVQTRWAHLNEEYSWFTRAQALALDAHFAVEQWVRARVGSLMSFNATSCVWRRAALEDAGGWSSDTVAEDLDLTATALLDGWAFVYTSGYAVPCEIPVTLSGFVRQQTRWARGSAQNVRKHLRRLLTAPTLSGWATFHSVLHVLHYMFYPLLLGWILLHVVVTATSSAPGWLLFAGFCMTTPGPLGFLALGQVATDRSGRLARLLAAVPLTLVGVGITWRMTRAVIGGFRETGGSFARTPKFGIDGSRKTWRTSSYDQALDRVGPETALGCWCLLGVGLAVVTATYRMALSLAVFALSFFTVVCFAAWQR